MKRIFALALTIFMVLSLVACGGQKETEPSTGNNQTNGQKETAGNIKFGLCIGTTGSLALEGDFVVKAVNMAIDEINAGGGVLGRKLEVAIQDDAGQADSSVMVIQKFGEDKDVVGVIGPHMSASVLAIDSIATQYQLPCLVGGTVKSISDLNNDYIYRHRNSDRLNAVVATDFLVHHLNCSKIGILYNNADLGNGAKETIEETLESFGMKVVAAEAHNPGDVDMTGQILKLKDAGVDSIIVYCFPAEAAIIVRQLNELGMGDLPIIGGATFTSTGYYGACDESYVDGTYAVTDFVADDPESADFVAAFNSVYGTNPDNTAFEYYDAVYLLADALERAGKVDRQALAEAYAATTDFHGNQGHMYCDDYNDMVHQVIVAQNHGTSAQKIYSTTESEIFNK